MGGERTVDNCYGLLGLTSEPQIICNNATIDDSELWHQRWGHLNFTDAQNHQQRDCQRSTQDGEN